MFKADWYFTDDIMVDLLSLATGVHNGLYICQTFLLGGVLALSHWNTLNGRLIQETF